MLRVNLYSWQEWNGDIDDDSYDQPLPDDDDDDPFLSELDRGLSIV